MRLWRSFPTFRGEARIESWIYRIAMNASMTHVSKVLRKRGLLAACPRNSRTRTFRRQVRAWNTFYGASWHSSAKSMHQY